MFFAGVYISPIKEVNGAYYSKVSVNGFVYPNTKVPDTDTQFRHYTPKEIFELDFTPQNVELRPRAPVNYMPGGVKHPRMDSSFEEAIPVLFSPLIPDSDEEDSDENIELESISNRLPEENLPSPPELLGEYFEEDSDEDENIELESISNALL